MHSFTLSQQVERLRAAIPIDGEEWTYLWKLTTVPKSFVAEHHHPHWVACTHVPSLEGQPPIELIVGGKLIRPEPWEIIVIPPGTTHEVPMWYGVNDRITFALAYEPGDNRQVIKNVTR